MNSPADQMAREIREGGPMTCARFMELALFAPGCGYYEKQHEIGQRGDFYTSVSVGRVFGELLAFQFAGWTEKLEGARIVEAGGHEGRLAADILRWMQRFRPELFKRLEYVLIEPSAARQGWQRETLREWEGRVTWVEGIEAWPERGVEGVIFGNEFLDAMPAHRLGWDSGERRWFEWRVAVEGERFVWRRGAMSDEVAGKAPGVPAELGAVLPDGYTVEVSPLAAAWWKAAAGKLRAGKLLTIDYGLTDEEWFSAERMGGTLRAYDRHHADGDVLSNPGGKDLTAHVNFSALQRAGEEAGLRTEGLTGQSVFLTRIFAAAQGAPGGFGEWSSERVRQFQTLTHPEHLGRGFRVLVQGVSEPFFTEARR